jgi:nitrogen fixation-related uncharacterized protein
MNEAREGISCAGLVLGALALAISTQAGYSLAYQTCGTSPALLILIAAGSLVVALIGGLLSLWSWRRSGQVDDNQRSAPVGMMAAIGTLAALLFSLVIVLQGAASILLSGCLR